ncbi:MAG: MarR family transcriptional regulator [Sinobacteraceae bacterium]|nr:MarR family transcriptional regulator [Nevskiaceae bacterium]
MKNRPAEKIDVKHSRTKENLRAWLRLLTCTNLIERDIQTYMRATEVTLPRFDFLAALYKADGELSMGEISRLLMVSRGNVTGLAERLEKQGLIHRWQWPDDRRHWYVALTEKGRTIFRQLSVEHEGWVSTAFEGLDDVELEQLMTLLAKLKVSASSSHARGKDDEAA